MAENATVKTAETTATPAREAHGADGLRKAAILLVALDEGVAAEILGHLSDDEARALSREIAALGVVDEAQVRAVVEEFQRLLEENGFVRTGGMEQAANLLRRSFPASIADRLIGRLAATGQSPPFGFLKDADVGALFPYLQDEHPQTLALVLSYLDADRAAEILQRLSPERQAEVVRRIATMEDASPDVIKQVESGLQVQLSSLRGAGPSEAGGLKRCAAILNLVDKTAEKAILEGLETEAPEISEEIRKLMFVFEDLINVDDRGIQAVLKEVDNKQLAMALKGASPELREKIFGNMSKRAAESVQEEIDLLGPVRVSDVRQAQQAIVDVVRRLEEAGEIVVGGKGGEGEMIV